VRQNEDIERDIARLADGTLTTERSREVEARVSESPELQALLGEQRHALQMVGSLDEPAPARLRARVESLREKRSSPRMRVRRAGFAGALVAVAAAVVVALVAVLPSGAGGPSLSEASALTLKPATQPAPVHSFDGTLELNVDGVPYPFWQEDFGWKAVGKRVDKLNGRTATTVFYRRGRQRVGYTIVTGQPVSVSGSPSVHVRNGVRFRSLPIRGTTVVTWERKGHSCILSGQGVSRAKLLKLAAWGDSGSLPYGG
jgi:hypothetical protein